VEKQKDFEEEIRIKMNNGRSLRKKEKI